MFGIGNVECEVMFMMFLEGIRRGRMGSENMGMFGIEFDLFGSRNMKVGKIMVIEMRMFEEGRFFK